MALPVLRVKKERRKKKMKRRWWKWLVGIIAGLLLVIVPIHSAFGTFLDYSLIIIGGLLLCWAVTRLIDET